MVRAVRDMDELEGTLLPVATEVLECGPGNELIPVTTQVFDYDMGIASVQQQQQQQQAEEQVLKEAIPIPNNANGLNYAGVSDDSKTTVGKAKQTGIIRSEEELECIRKNKSKIIPRNYHEENAFKSANNRAKHRDREGLEVKNDHLGSAFTEKQLPEKLQSNKKDEEESDKKPENPADKGYQVKEYDCTTYDTSDYKVTEYKSIYD